MPFVPSHMRMKPPKSNEVQVTESPPQQQKVVEQTTTNNQDQDNSYDFESELEDLLVSILDEMTIFRPFDFGTLCLAFGLVVRVVRTAHLTGNVLPRILAGWNRLSSPVLTVYVNLVLLYRLTY